MGVIIGDDVFDVTKFLPDHPGGKKAIMLYTGKDATEEFDMLHDRKVIKKYGIDQGTVSKMDSSRSEAIISASCSQTARSGQLLSVPTGRGQSGNAIAR